MTLPVSPRPYNHTLPTGETLTIMIDDRRDTKLTEFGKATLRDRYLLPGESYQDMFARVAVANSNEVIIGVMDGHAQRMYDAISNLWFMPATPVLSNSGSDRGLPISCFLNRVGDSMHSIAETVNENIWLAAKGGGIGTNWGDVRELGHPIAGSLTGKTSGIIPFIQWMDAQTLAISQGSLRRGSAAVYLDMRHPEIVDFMDMRRHTGGDPRRKAQNLHHGVMVSDDFMNTALAETPEARKWDLISPKSGEVKETVDARDLFIQLLINRLETGEPYMVFSDTVNANMPEISKELGLTVSQSNLCSEITLPTGPDHLGKWRTAVCCLSSLNMETGIEWFNNKPFIKDVLEFLDNVLTVFITKTEKMQGFERARYSAMRERSVGLGMMGFHSMLQSKAIPFESEQARGLNIRFWAWLESVAGECNEEMAAERGACPDAIDANARNPSIKLKRLTNVFSIAPTASISIIAGGASPCGEPIPANSFTQKTLSGSFNVRNRHLAELLRTRYYSIRGTVEKAPLDLQYLLNAMPAFADVMKMEIDDWMEAIWDSVTINNGSVQQLTCMSPMEKAVYRTAFEMDQRWVIRHHADRTPMICQSQSLNLFIPPDVHKKDLKDLHVMAWELGVKSLYYVRSRSVSKAMAVGNLAGEMPSADIEKVAPAKAAASIYEEPEICLSCQ